MHERGPVGGDADHDLLELHLDQATLGAELDDVALDLDRHAGDELGALQHREHVVQRDAALELERGQARRDLVEAAAVLVERRERLVGLGEHDGDVLEDVLRAVEVERDDARSAEIAITSASVCLETRSAVRCRVPVSSEMIVGSGISCTFAQRILVAFSDRMIAPSIFASW